MNKIYKIAMAYKNRGISFYPVKTNSKAAAVKWKKYQTQLPEDSEIRYWFVTKRFENLAIITGKISSIIVIDCDDDMAIQMWKYICEKNDDVENSFENTVQVQTKRGRHFYFKYPEGEEVRSHPDHFGKYVKIEIKSNGCSIKAPPSKYIDSDKEYVFEKGKTLQPFPSWLLRELNPPKREEINSQVKLKGNGKKWLVDAIHKAFHGNRNFACVWMADQLRDDDIPISDAIELVKEFVNLIPQTPTRYTLDEAITTLKSRYSLPKRSPAKRNF